MRTQLLLGLTALLATAGCTPQPGARSAGIAREGPQCFSALSVRHYRPVGRDAVDVEISRNRVYRLDLGAGCFDLDWSQSAVLRSRSGSFICSPGDAELVVPSRQGGERCLVTGVRRLSEAEAQDSRRRRPNAGP
jgi:hypothetical protein